LVSEKRKTWACFLSCIALLLAFAVQSTAAGDKLVIVTIPDYQAETLKIKYAPLVELLSRKLHKQVDFVIAQNYEEVGKRIDLQAADLGILGPNSYVEAKEKFPELIYLATCKDPEAYYHSLIITRKSSRLKSLAALKGTSFGYTETKSTSGYLYPRQMIKKAGFDPDTFFSKTYFLNRHDKIYDAIAKGTIDAGGVSSLSWNEAIKRNGDVFQILGTSDPIPWNPVVAGPHLSPKIIAEIREILRNAEHDKTFTNSSSTLRGFLVKDDSFYDIVRQERRQK